MVCDVCLENLRKLEKLSTADKQSFVNKWRYRSFSSSHFSVHVFPLYQWWVNASGGITLYWNKTLQVTWAVLLRNLSESQVEYIFSKMTAYTLVRWLFARKKKDYFVTCLLLQIIEVKFEKFDVERDNYCRYDHVSIFNGPEINDAKRIGKYCGDSPPA